MSGEFCFDLVSLLVLLVAYLIDLLQFPTNKLKLEMSTLILAVSFKDINNNNNNNKRILQLELEAHFKV